MMRIDAFNILHTFLSRVLEFGVIRRSVGSILKTFVKREELNLQRLAF